MDFYRKEQGEFYELYFTKSGSLSTTIPNNNVTLEDVYRISIEKYNWDVYVLKGEFNYKAIVEEPSLLTNIDLYRTQNESCLFSSQEFQHLKLLQKLIDKN